MEHLPEYVSGRYRGLISDARADTTMKTSDKNKYLCLLLAIVLRGRLHPDARAAFIQLSQAFNCVFSARCLTQQQLAEVGSMMLRAVVALECVLPASEMSRSIHAASHLAYQIRVAGLPDGRSMTWGERQMAVITSGPLSNKNVECSMGNFFMEYEALNILSYFARMTVWVC